MNIKLRSLVFLLATLLFLNVLTAAAGAEKSIFGIFEISEKSVTQSNASPEDAKAILETIKRSWECYLKLDGGGYSEIFTKDALRFNQRSMKIQHGRREISDGMKTEWQYFERPGGVISEAIKACDVSITINGAEGKKTAAVTYQLDLTGGARWKYDDQGIVFSMLVQNDGKWNIAYYADSWGLDIGGSTGVFEYDFVHPANDIDRAANLYKDLMGEPEKLSKDEAVFDLAGGKFILEKISKDGFSTIHKDKSNGYAIIYVSDIEKIKARLIDAEAEFIAGTDKKYIMKGQDQRIIVLDPAENILVLQQRNFRSTEQKDDPKIKIADNSVSGAKEPFGKAAVAIQENWLKMDAKKIAGRCAGKRAWLDDTRRKDRGFEDGGDDLEKNLHSKYWNKYDNGPKGLLADMTISDLKISDHSGMTLVSFIRDLRGTGSHSYNEKSLVTQLFNTPEKCLMTMATAYKDNGNRLVTDLDYSGYPATDLKASQEFYQKTLSLGKPYTDSGWRGFWGAGAVFGIFTADPEKDGIPVKRSCNGYISFWTPSAEKVLRYAKEHNLGLPVIPSINSAAGITKEPGYSQAVISDTEGNLTVFTEYSGKKKK